MKDYQQVIVIKADCYHPQLKLESTALLFIGTPYFPSTNNADASTNSNNTNNNNKQAIDAGKSITSNDSNNNNNSDSNNNLERKGLTVSGEVFTSSPSSSAASVSSPSSSSLLSTVDDTADYIEFPIEETTKNFTITNNYDTPLQYIVKNDSSFFIFEGAKDIEIPLDGKATQSIVIKLNIPVIMNNRRFLLKV